jgi:hypothetical protein
MKKQFRSLQTEIEGLSGQINDEMAYEENLRLVVVNLQALLLK